MEAHKFQNETVKSIQHSVQYYFKNPTNKCNFGLLGKILFIIHLNTNLKCVVDTSAGLQVKKCTKLCSASLKKKFHKIPSKSSSL